MFQDIEDFVYDLYYAQTCEDIWFESDNIMVWRPEHSETNSEHESESSDSNSESNWRNDYPDTDPDRSRDSNSDSDDYFDVYQTDEDLYGSKRDENTNLFGYNYSEYRRGRREESESSFNSDLDETYSSDNEERLTNDKEEMTD
ncbi:probable RNA polymerase II nuclear localization protein SLC7A6OS [Pogonomyrmex barbatus]|uniref:Probable RNA polymerase II nuclear localization protein SLC7A6OS n=1 Tax=Pogonomyrmex barbatus TaxID=144034 RepID=A0A6I9W3P0_9HYME|nr:probable RNA polymerase II nuclear localization protein SLC7A6OS [Pogonomyrmex barbatus]